MLFWPILEVQNHILMADPTKFAISCLDKLKDQYLSVAGGDDLPSVLWFLIRHNSASRGLRIPPITVPELMNMGPGDAALFEQGVPIKMTEFLEDNFRGFVVFRHYRQTNDFTFKNDKIEWDDRNATINMHNLSQTHVPDL